MSPFVLETFSTFISTKKRRWLSLIMHTTHLVSITIWEGSKVQITVQQELQLAITDAA